MQGEANTNLPTRETAPTRSNAQGREGGPWVPQMPQTWWFSALADHSGGREATAPGVTGGHHHATQLPSLCRLREGQASRSFSGGASFAFRVPVVTLDPPI